jgi:hypothetical protein
LGKNRPRRRLVRELEAFAFGRKEYGMVADDITTA